MWSRRILAFLLSLAIVLNALVVFTPLSVSAATVSSLTEQVGITSSHKHLPEDEHYQYTTLKTTTEKKVYKAVLNAIKIAKNVVNISSYKLASDKVDLVIRKVLSDHPKYFYVSGKWSYSTVISGKTSYVDSVYLYYTDGETVDKYDNNKLKIAADRAKISKQIKALNKKTKEIVDKIPVSAPNIIKEKLIHDYLADNVVYDYAAAEKAKKGYYDIHHQWDLYGAIVEGISVCEGYSKAFMFLCHLVGINAMTVSGYSGEDHMWNEVNIDGEWYMVDVTWDDDKKYGALDRYFNVTTNELSETHVIYNTGLVYPTCSASKKAYKTLCIDFENHKLPSNYKSIIDRVVKYREKWLPLYIGEDASVDNALLAKNFMQEDSPVQKYIKSKGYDIVIDSSYVKYDCYLNITVKYLCDASDHKWKAATCTTAKTCTVCKKTSGKALGHTYSHACDKNCNRCGAKRTVKAHTYKLYVTRKATLSANGAYRYKCSTCGYITSTANVIRKATSFRLSIAAYTYDGKVKTPSVTVKDSAGKTLKKNTDYTVTYASGRKNVGTYKVTIKMKGKYIGTKTLTFNIIPPKTSVIKLTPTKTTMKVYVSRKTAAQATGYQIQYATNKNFKGAKTKWITKNTTGSVTLTGLKSKTTQFVRVRTYKKVGKTTYYSGWSTISYKKTK